MLTNKEDKEKREREGKQYRRIVETRSTLTMK